MINYRTKDIGMTYEYDNKIYSFHHDIFKLNSFEVQGDKVRMLLQLKDKEYDVTQFYDERIKLTVPMYLKLAYVSIDGNIRSHGYEASEAPLDASTWPVLNRTLKETIDITMYEDRVHYFIGLIQDQTLKCIVEGLLFNHYRAQFLKWPAAVSVHHNYSGGLIQHTANVAKIAYTLADSYANINMDLIIAGALLHDAGKMIEYTEDCKISEAGTLCDHISYGKSLIEQYCMMYQIPIDNTIQHLIHIVLSHHGKKEWGSPKIPATQEAFIVHMADYIDTNMFIYYGTLKTLQPRGSSYNKLLDTYVYNSHLEDYNRYDV